MQHIFTGTTAPTSAPAGVGHHYVDTVAKKTYLSVGISSSADWFEVGAGSGVSFQATKEVKTLSSGDISNGYIDLSYAALAGSVVLSQSRVLFYEGIDYSLSLVGGVTRLSFLAPIAVGGPEAFESGEILSIQYLRSI